MSEKEPRTLRVVSNLPDDIADFARRQGIPEHDIGSILLALCNPPMHRRDTEIIAFVEKMTGRKMKPEFVNEPVPDIEPTLPYIDEHLYQSLGIRPGMNLEKVLSCLWINMRWIIMRWEMYSRPYQPMSEEDRREIDKLLRKMAFPVNPQDKVIDLYPPPRELTAEQRENERRGEREKAQIEFDILSDLLDTFDREWRKRFMEMYPNAAELLKDPEEETKTF